MIVFLLNSLEPIDNLKRFLQYNSKRRFYKLTEKEIEVVKVKCPNCGSEELDMPENIEKRDKCFLLSQN